MSATLINGRPERKQLSDQLDRLDSILDGLSGALNEAVADAAKEGVKEAVTSAVIELLTNTDLKDALHKATAPETAAKPSFWARLKAKINQATSQVKSVVVSAASVVVDRVAQHARRLPFGQGSPNEPCRSPSSWQWGSGIGSGGKVCRFSWPGERSSR